MDYFMGAPTGQIINVGCMMPYMGYTPRTAKDILEGYKGYKELLYA